MHDTSGSGVEHSFKKAVASLARTDSATDILGELQSEMIAALHHVLAVDAANVGYLAPLITPNSALVGIATLNYDRSVELAAETAGTPLDTGIQQWTGGYAWRWGDAPSLRLLKLHGSLDWYLTNHVTDRGVIDADRVVVWSGEARRSPAPHPAELGVVFGAGAKLRPDGPFLAMLHEFGSFLADSERLIVIGYSFRDDHINAAIRRWFVQAPEPKITIIDPYPPAPSTRPGASFYQQILTTVDPPFPTGVSVPVHRLIKEHAADGRELFGTSV